jgi:hypothetical protein
VDLCTLPLGVFELFSSLVDVQSSVEASLEQLPLVVTASVTAHDFCSSLTGPRWKLFVLLTATGACGIFLVTPPTASRVQVTLGQR